MCYRSVWIVVVAFDAFMLWLRHMFSIYEKSHDVMALLHALTKPAVSISILGRSTLETADLATRCFFDCPMCVKLCMRHIYY